jgi:hypothetical protein
MMAMKRKVKKLMLKLTAIVLILSPFFGTLPSVGASFRVSKPAFAETKTSALTEQPVSNPYDSIPLPMVKYCELIERHTRYSGKTVRVSASWKFGFETTFLFDGKCPKEPGAWLEFADDKDTCPETKKNRDAPGPHDREAEVIVTGRLVGPGRYGHLGAYEYKFVVTCLEKIKITGSDLK